MKKISLLFFISLMMCKGFAQYREVEKHEPEEEQTRGFRKDHLFTGGGVNLSLSNYNFGIGVNPVFGYSINKWFDAGIALNFTYLSARLVYDNGYEVFTNGDKVRQTDIGPSVFGRVYPVKFLFAQVQLEQNFIAEKYIYGDGAPSDKIKYDATSLLLGAGYSSGREGVGDFFYYISVSVDVLKNKNSPYVNIVRDLGTGGYRVYMLPIIKAGIQIPLFRGKGNY